MSKVNRILAKKAQLDKEKRNRRMHRKMADKSRKEQRG